LCATDAQTHFLGWLCDAKVVWPAKKTFLNETMPTRYLLPFCCVIDSI
jgi:hypothetical protein